MPKGGDGLIELSIVFQDSPQIVMRLGPDGPQSDGPTDQIDCDVIPSLLMGGHSQIMHRASMLRLAGEDLPIKPLRLLQASGLLVPHRQIEALLDRELGHEPSNLIRNFPYETPPTNVVGNFVQDTKVWSVE
jgi:hypothetical protein